MLGLSSWAPVVSGIALLGAFLIVEAARYRAPKVRHRMAVGVLAGVGLVAALVVALGW